MIVLLAHKGHQTLCSDRRVIATPPERNKKGIDRYLGRICMFHEQTAYERRHLLCGSLEIGAHDGRQRVNKKSTSPIHADYSQ